MSIQIFGLPVSRGVAIGRAVLIASGRVDVPHHFVDPARVDEEIARLTEARDTVAVEFDALKRDLPSDVPAELAALLDVHQMLLQDEALIGAAGDWIRERHYNAEWALSAQLEVLARQFDEMEDAYLRERKADLEQVVERLLRVLGRGVGLPAMQPHARDFGGDEPLVLVASDISPADMLTFKRSVFTGFVTDVGGKTSHTAIVARSMDIPAVVGARQASGLIRQDDCIIIDGDAGLVIVDPSPIVLEEYRFRQRQSELERSRLARLRHTPAVTLDGERIELLANIEMPEDAPVALEAGSAGVGLFRSEFLFMGRGIDLPDEEEQYGAYRRAVEGMNGLPVTIRTVDIGADKPLEGMTQSELRHESVLNPALGLRAIRWSLSEPSMFRRQLRALFRAAAHGPVKILIPMLGSAHEIRQTLEQVALVQRQLSESGKPIGKVQLGAMIEVPAAALTLPIFLKHFDFLSIGTNDLIQYTLAIDRADEAVAHLYDPWHPAVLNLVYQTIQQANAAGRGVSVCGEMAGDPAFTELLLAMGLRSFSMHPTQVAAVKQRVLRADTRRLAGAVDIVLASDEPEKAWAEAQVAGGAPALSPARLASVA
ncbi:phosphoenolpyruvate--protein phosphotransferase [Aquabacterium soli]|jgi:phosphoenolpyruvate-protein phosphotransferase (PTS system enzyme I)|uniref:Phosphoenolpyruvate-protein phosphotransferase n=1 Tax=Aquabacterium soli TaxID=2493092 RepID=A0A426VC45_9BURK|nr:phosphoenolpyruvate--protein phosphotransferase [Aquabacterium soli]RRS04432.1 phosphoenolpyruvate--protein phosphotransferase [Aquabacterium soli]